METRLESFTYKMRYDYFQAYDIGNIVKNCTKTMSYLQ